jgi:cell division protein FtsB
LSKGANIYWDSGNGTSAGRRTTQARRRRTAAKVSERRAAPFWVAFAIVTSIFVMLTVSINYRALSEAQIEAEKNERLGVQLQSLKDENLALQEEIHTLKTDPRVIEREAKKIGIDLRQEAQVSVPAVR